MNARPQRILPTASLTQSAPASPTNKGAHIQQAGYVPHLPGLLRVLLPRLGLPVTTPKAQGPFVLPWELGP